MGLGPRSLWNAARGVRRSCLPLPGHVIDEKANSPGSVRQFEPYCSSKIKLEALPQLDYANGAGAQTGQTPPGRAVSTLPGIINAHAAHTAFNCVDKPGLTPQPGFTAAIKCPQINCLLNKQMEGMVFALNNNRCNILLATVNY